MSRHGVACFLGLWLFGAALAPAGAFAGRSASLHGVFVGCATGQGLTECRVVGRDGADFYLSANLGCGGGRGNTPEALIEAIDENAWKGKTVDIEALLAPDGSLERVTGLRLAAPQPAGNETIMRVGVTLAGVIDQTDDGFTFRTGDTLYALVPGKGYRFGDLAELMARFDGAPARLHGDIVTAKSRPQFLITGTVP